MERSLVGKAQQTTEFRVGPQRPNASHEEVVSFPVFETLLSLGIDVPGRTVIPGPNGLEDFPDAVIVLRPHDNTIADVAHGHFGTILSE